MTDNDSDDTDGLAELQNQYGDQWYENGLLYAVDVKTFFDSDGDGVGDFVGLTSKLDYLDSIGVSWLWLLPFYKSPYRDNGYDVADYYSIDDRLGTLGQFVDFVREAHQRGIDVLIDLVVNHTSKQHPWFQQARADPESKFRDYYIWSDDPPEPEKEPIFPEEDSVWSYDEEAESYYYHRFYDFEPGLDHSNQDVRSAVCEIMDFWLQLGIDGFRIDGTPILLQRKGLDSTELDQPHRILKEYRGFVSQRNSDAVLLGEVGGEPDEVLPYFGDGTGDELQLIFNFVLTDYLFLALATGDVGPLVQGLQSTPLPPQNGQWANFLRNLDELNLEWLSETERETVLEKFSPDEEMQIFGRGSRRRLAPMLDDRRQLELAYSLLLTMSGTPILPYGDEIGMGDDLSLDGRTAVRTPMQWSDEENGGFSSADADDLIRPVISDGEYGYESVNVESQRADADSLLNWVRRAVGIRREYAAFAYGTGRIVQTDAENVVCHRLDDDSAVVAVHNLVDEPRNVSLDVGDELHCIFSVDGLEPPGGESIDLDLPGYGYCWFRA